MRPYFIFVLIIVFDDKKYMSLIPALKRKIDRDG